jgi:hypothetical protein
MVRYVDCALMGYHQVTTEATATTAGKVLYDGSRFLNYTVGTGTGGFLRWAGGVTPRYEFRDCLAGAAYLANSEVS